MKSYLVVDARNLLWRSTAAMLELSTDRHHTGGAYGFLNTLLRVHSEYPGDTIVDWEGVGTNFRYKLYPAYKTREETGDREDFLKIVKHQEKMLRKLLKLMGVPQYKGVECECDDVIGALVSHKLKKAGVTIYSMDSDLRQLVNKRVKILSATWKGEDVVYDEEKVIARHGVGPKKIADLKALMGDASDTIPGVKGVGEKTAVILVKAYGDVESVLKAARAGTSDWPTTERFRKLVADTKELMMFKQLTTIRRDVKLKVVRPCANKKKLLLKLKEYQFRSLIPKLDHLLALNGG
jgi:DNA polymerase I